MSDDNDDLKFRDQCAISIMTMLLGNNHTQCKTTLDLLVQYHGQVTENIFTTDNNKEYSLEKIEKYAQLSYKVADIMRKARLASFK